MESKRLNSTTSMVVVESSKKLKKPPIEPPSDKRFITILIIPALILFIGIILFPLVVGIYISFTNSSAAVGYFGTKVSILNYYELLFYGSLNSQQFWQYTYQTLFFTIVSVTIELLLGLIFALVLNKKFRGRSIARATLLIPWALPTIASATIYRYEILAPVDQFGLINSILRLWNLNPISFYGADAQTLFNLPVLYPFPPYFNWLAITQTMFTAITIDVWKTTPFFTLLILAALQIVPEDLHKAAEIDGASDWQRFRHIIWPLIKAGVGFALIFRVIDALRVYGAIVVFRDRSVQSMTTLAVQFWINTNQYGLASTVTVILAAFILIAAILILRFTQEREPKKKKKKVSGIKYDQRIELEESEETEEFDIDKIKEKSEKILKDEDPPNENSFIANEKKKINSSIQELTVEEISLSNINWIFRKRRIKKLVFVLIVIALCVFCAAPFIWILLRSFRNPYVTQTSFELLPSVWGAQSYQIIFSNSQIYGVSFGRAMLNGFMLSGMTVIVVLFISSFIALAMAKYDIKYKGIITVLLFSMTSLPPLIIAIPFYIETNAIGNLIPALDLRDNILGLVLPYAAFNLPLSTFVLQSFFHEIPDDLWKAAKVDGASNFQIFRKIILPLTVPGIFTVAILVFIASWNELLFAQIWLTTDSHQTVPRAILRFVQSPLSLTATWNTNLVLLAATSIATIPLVVVVLIFQKKIITGITSGAVKG